MESLRHSKSGAALLTVLISLLLMSLMLLEFQYSGMVERKLAFNQLNRLQAYYLAKSAVRLGVLRLRVFGQATKQVESSGNKQIKNFPRKQEILDAIWRLPFPKFPPEAESIAELDVRKDRIAAEELLKATKVEDGHFEMNIMNDSAKINLNLLQLKEEQCEEVFDPRSEEAPRVVTLLLNFLDNLLSDSEDPYEEYGNMRPEDIVGRVIDWVSPCPNSVLGGDKNGFYTKQDPPYKAKGSRFFTVDELKLVQDVDDRIFNKLRPNVTASIGNEGKINLNDATHTILRTVYKDFSQDDLKRIDDKKSELGGMWPAVSTFKAFVINELGLSGFETLYPENEIEEVLSVGSQSFIVEGIGTIDKSASQIERKITARVELTPKDVSGEVDPNKPAKTAAECDDTTHFFFNRRECRFKPSSSEKCRNLTGTWEERDDRLCCRFAQNQVAGGVTCIEKKDLSQIQSPYPGQLRITSWAES